MSKYGVFGHFSHSENSDQTNKLDFESDLNGIIKLRKSYPNNPLNVSLDLNYLKDMINLLSTKITKWSNTLKQFVGNLPTNCLNEFDHFVGLALKE